MSIQQYYNPNTPRGSRSCPTYCHVRYGLTLHSLDPRYFVYL